MRIVVCEEDSLMAEMVEAIAVRAGHDVVGLARSAADGVGLIAAARPDVVVLDMSLGYNSDFDMIEAALSVDARPIVFSHDADDQILSRYRERPRVIVKPDLVALEELLSRVARDESGEHIVERDRRQRPSRPSSGPDPMGPVDTQAFFVAINDALPGDAIGSVEVRGSAPSVAAAASALLRGTDRLVALAETVRFFLPGGGDEGIRSLMRRLAETHTVSTECSFLSVVVGDGESGADAYHRLTHAGEPQAWPADG